MKKYESYKPIEELWLTQIPASWEDIKIKFLFSERSEKGYPDEPLLVASQNMGVVPKGVYGNRTVEATKDLHLLKLVKVGDFVISLRSFQGGIEYAYYQGIISPAYTIMVPKPKIESGYFRYLAKSRLFIELLQLCVTGIREGQNIDYGKLKNHLIPVPPCEEQNQIVRYLEWQTSKINKLISAKKKQIELLQEAKYAFVSDLISHGLKHCTLKKDSNVSWLGTIPAHWSTVKLRNILTPVSIKNCSDMQLLSVVREKGVIVRDTEDQESNRNFIPDDLSGYKRVLKNQFVINKMKAWQGSYGISEFDGIVSPAYFVFDIHFKNFEYFHYAIRSKIYVNFFAQASAGIRVGQWDLSIDKMREIPFILPPEDEQVQIVKAIKIHTQKVDIALGKLKKEIECLLEFRNKIISDVVTGQIDVRSIDVPDFELVEELADEAEEPEDEMEVE